MFNRKISKKAVTAALTGALSVLMAATVMAAPSNNGSFGQKGAMGRGERPGFEQGEPGMPEGEMPEMPEGERPEMPEGEMPERPEGERPEMPEGGRGGFRMDLDTDALSEAIDALEDEDTKAGLAALLADYEEAKEALDSAIENKEEDIDSYREAEADAMKALFDALEAAGIDTKPAIPDGDEIGEDERPLLPEDEALDKPADGEEGATFREFQEKDEPQDAQGAQTNRGSGVFTKIADWFRSVFKR